MQNILSFLFFILLLYTITELFVCLYLLLAWLFKTCIKSSCTNDKRLDVRHDVWIIVSLALHTSHERYNKMKRAERQKESEGGDVTSWCCVTCEGKSSVSIFSCLWCCPMRALPGPQAELAGCLLVRGPQMLLHSVFFLSAHVTSHWPPALAASTEKLFQWLFLIG